MLRCGVFDSGIGGLTVAKELLGSFDNDIEISYFADFFHLPYGPRPLSEVSGFALNIISFLFDEGVDIVVMGCNMSAASGAHNIWQQKSDKPVFEIITPAGIEAVNVSKNKNIGVISTEGTYKSGIYQETLKAAGAENITVVPCPLFVPFIESEVKDEKAIVQATKEYLTPIKSAGADTLIYGCTHYPFLEKYIIDVIGGEVNLINPGVAVTGKVKEYYNENIKDFEHKSSDIKHKYYCTGDPENLIKFAPFLGQKIENVKVVKELE